MTQQTDIEALKARYPKERCLEIENEFLIAELESLREQNTELRRQLDVANAKANGEQPKAADFFNGDAAMWVEDGKVKAEWNGTAPHQEVKEQG